MSIIKVMLSGSGQDGDGWIPSETDLERYIVQLTEAVESGAQVPIAAAQLRLCKVLATAWPLLPDPRQRRTALVLAQNGWAGSGDDLAMIARHLTI